MKTEKSPSQARFLQVQMKQVTAH